jgi:hypothetical protein
MVRAIARANKPKLDRAEADMPGVLFPQIDVGDLPYGNEHLAASLVSECEDSVAADGYGAQQFLLDVGGRVFALQHDLTTDVLNADLDLHDSSCKHYRVARGAEVTVPHSRPEASLCSRKAL